MNYRKSYQTFGKEKIAQPCASQWLIGENYQHWEKLGEEF